MLALLITAALSAEIYCNDSINYPNWINSECNDVGKCNNGACYCCDSSRPTDYCKDTENFDIPGKFDGKYCEKAVEFISAEVELHIAPADVTDICLDDGNPSSPNHYGSLYSHFNSSYSYYGSLILLPCQTCTVNNTCDFQEETPGETGEETSGLRLSFGTDFNTYYDLSCGDGTIPTQHKNCDANQDNGAEARLQFNTALDVDNGHRLFIDYMKTVGLVINKMSVKEIINVGSNYQINPATRDPTHRPSSTPTHRPSSTPTSKPEGGQGTAICEKYVNDVGDISTFSGGGASCRAHINESWPGGRTCESPYIVCLPQENTPAFDIMGNRYKNDTHRYTLQECKQECSYDQRCLGIEFRADDNSTSGDCLLLGSIPLAIEDEFLNIISPSTLENSPTLDSSATGVDALCFSKKIDTCNPFFEAEDLTDEMLECYCPNNRKGFYTKKVKRTVNNTRFCDNDASVDERIRKAQANRMFHLCENWCLFGPHHPEQENWYWDPWKECWRETYAARGTHRAYCDRVIRNPDSIELQYINLRSNRFCDASKPPTYAPVPDVNTTWYLSDVLESCDEVCGRNGLACAAEQTTRRFETEEELIHAFSEAGFDCTDASVIILMDDTRYVGFALPGLRGSNRCVNRQAPLDHLKDLGSDCGRKIGFDWQRLCACY